MSILPTDLRSKVLLRCVLEGKKVRVRFEAYVDEHGVKHHNAYWSTLNCQFPRRLRVAGRRFAVDALDVSLSTSAKSAPFYHVRTRNLHVLSDPEVDTVHREAECVACMDRPPSKVLVPCGHLCLCAACFETLEEQSRCERVRCPLCRQHVGTTIFVERR